MDSITDLIAQLRASAENTLNIANEVAAAAALPVAVPVGAGLPPTAGAQGPLEALPAAAPDAGAPPSALLAAAAAALPPPPPIQAQQTLGVATPAKFGDAEANALHYLNGIGLYAVPQELLEAEDAAYKAWREAMVATNVAPYGKKGEARGAERVARYILKDATQKVADAKKLKERYQAYYDGTWASLPSTWASLPTTTAAAARYYGKAYFIYRFFIFEEVVSGPYTGTQAAHWKPIGLLNPHAYIGSKLMSKRACFLDFVDDSQPAPDVAAYWRAKVFGEEEEDEEDEDAHYELSEEDDEDEDDDCLCEGDGWRLRLKPSTACVHVAAGGGGGGPSEAVYVPAAAPAPAPRPREYPVLPFQSEPAAAAGPTTPTKAAACGGGGGGAATPAAEWAHAEAKSSGLARRLAFLEPADDTPAGFSPVIEGAELLLDRLDPRAESNKELREDLWEGRWTTLPDCRRVLIYRHHAFAPPADGSYRTAQPLQHLGFYHFHDRTIDATTTSLPALPTQDAWPF